jgi:hypothetical protein
MPDIDVSQMYVEVYNVVANLLPGVTIRGGYQNVGAPVGRDDLGRPTDTVIVIEEIPTSSSQGRADVSEWVEDSPSSVGGSSQAKEDYEAIFNIHQVGGRGELLQKLRAGVELDSTVALMRTAGIVCRRVNQTIPMYNEVNERWGPDCMAEFIFAGSYRLTQPANKITDVKYTLNEI